jgi:acetylornithine deacetylase/succinyl-diaminopimelate desuccinylase-like protein
MSLEKALAHVDSTADRRLSELMELLRIPSVSTLPQHKADVRRAAEWVRARLEKAGVKATVFETPGHPIVYGERLDKPGKPTVLIYGHYDVQPAEPLELWTKGAFEPWVNEKGDLVARGSTDDKGQMLTWIHAAEAWIQGAGGLPVNMKFLIEGEEEIGSKNLDPWIAANRERLKADCVAISDSDQYAPDMPALTYGLRGLAYMEVKVTGPDKDLHSGMFGGAAPNPINALATIIAGLRDAKTGKVLVDGFYDRVRPLADWERKMFASLPQKDGEMMAYMGVSELPGEEGYSALERIWARPTLDANGIQGGFQGAGAKTVIASWASAKVSMRLVPDQRADEIADAFKRTVERLAPAGVKVEVTKHSASDPAILERETPWAQAGERALERGFGRRPVFMRCGGSIPVALTFKKQLGCDSVMLGYGLPDDGAHSPNEKFHVADFHRGCRTSAAFLGEVAATR